MIAERLEKPNTRPKFNIITPVLSKVEAESTSVDNHIPYGMPAMLRVEGERSKPEEYNDNQMRDLLSQPVEPASWDEIIESYEADGRGWNFQPVDEGGDPSLRTLRVTRKVSGTEDALKEGNVIPSFTYDVNGRMAAIGSTVIKDGVEKIASDQTFTYDDKGHVLSHTITDWQQGTITSRIFEYDRPNDNPAEEKKLISMETMTTHRNADGTFGPSVETTQPYHFKDTSVSDFDNTDIAEAA